VKHPIRSDSTYLIEPDTPDMAIIKEAAGRIREGGVVVFPTQGLYGLGANALDSGAVDRIFAIKKRPPEKPVLILINSVSEMDELVREIPRPAIKIMDACWPGGVTLVCHARETLPSNLTAGTEKIGVRLPVHPVARHLVRIAAVPITGTSANLSGQAGCADIHDIDPRVFRDVDMILDAGKLKGGPGSTIVDVTVSPPRILREGVVPETRIREVLADRPR
jgi:L-threonylcarbamoyladenylate synthase